MSGNAFGHSEMLHPHPKCQTGRAWSTEQELNVGDGCTATDCMVSEIIEC